MNYFVSKTNRITDTEDKVIYFSVEEFVEEIVIRETCFVCGALKTDKEFNDEHIIPKWLLKRFGIFDEK